MDYYSTLGTKGLSSHEKTWGNLKMHITKLIKAAWKDIYHMIPTIGHSGEDKTMDVVKSAVVGRVSRGGERWDEQVEHTGFWGQGS